MMEKTSLLTKVKPRGKGKINIDKGLPEAYKHYCEQTKDSPDKYKVSRATYGKIIKEVHKEIARKILEEAVTYKMPAGLPTIRIKKYKRKIKFLENGSVDPKALAINWQLTRKLWSDNPKAKEEKRFVYFVNDHTDGYSAMFVVDKYRATLPNLGPYKFKASRKNNRRIAEILLNPYNKIDYYE